MTYDSDNPYPDGAPVGCATRGTSRRRRPSRNTWPWLPASIVQRCGPDEWQVCVETRGVVMLKDGSRPPEDVPDDELLFPCCYRDSSELRAAPDGQ